MSSTSAILLVKALLFCILCVLDYRLESLPAAKLCTSEDESSRQGGNLLRRREREYNTESEIRSGDTRADTIAKIIRVGVQGF